MTADQQSKPMYRKPDRPNVYIVRGGLIEDLQEWINFMACECGYELAELSACNASYAIVAMVHRPALAETLGDLAEIAGQSSATRAAIARNEGWPERERCLDNPPAPGALPE